MAFLGANDAVITLGQALETGIAVSLAKTLVGLAITMDAVYPPLEIQLKLLAKVVIQRDFMLTQQHGIAYWIFQLRLHFAHRACRNEIH